MNELLQWLIAPLQHQFMIKALLVSAFVGIVCSVLSCYITLKGWSLMGDAVSHAVVPGVVLSYILRIPFAIGAFVFGFGATLLIGFIKDRTRIKEDAVIGVVFTGFFALGIVMVSKTNSNVDLFHILFGNVLGITSFDLIQTVIIGLLTLGVIGVLRKDLLLFCFDPNHAQVIGLNTSALYYTFLSLLSLTIVAAQQTVGIILVISMLVTPGAIAYLLTDRFDQMIFFSVVAGVSSSIIGTYLSYHLDGATGGCIVVILTLLFFATVIFAPKHGLLAKGIAPSAIK